MPRQRRKWLNQLHEDSPETVPHPLPDQPALERLIADLPLLIVDFVDEPEMYLAVLQVGFASRTAANLKPLEARRTVLVSASLQKICKTSLVFMRNCSFQSLVSESGRRLLLALSLRPFYRPFQQFIC